MKFVIAFIACLAVSVWAAPASLDSDTSVVDFVNENPGTGEYNWKILLTDGQEHAEEGHLVNGGSEDAHVAVKGYFEYKWDDKVYRVTYFADETGYHAEGDHIPH